MPHFNPGDRVRRVGGSFSAAVQGQEYIVAQYLDRRNLRLLNDDALYLPDSFELVEPGEEYTCYLVIFGKPDGSRSPQITSTEERLSTLIHTFTSVGWTVKAKKRIKTVLRNQPEGI